MPKYQASGTERGAVLDFVDYPLNNRWWLEDEFTKVRALPDEAATRGAARALRTWEDPAPAASTTTSGTSGARRTSCAAEVTGGDPSVEDGPMPHFSGKDQGKSRKRLSWQAACAGRSRSSTIRSIPTATYIGAPQRPRRRQAEDRR